MSSRKLVKNIFGYVYEDVSREDRHAGGDKRGRLTLNLESTTGVERKEEEELMLAHSLLLVSF